MNPQAGNVMLQYGAIGVMLLGLATACALGIRWFFKVAADRFLKHLDKVEAVMDSTAERIGEMGAAMRELVAETRSAREEAERGRLAAIKTLREEIERNGNGHAKARKKRRGT